MRTFECEGNSLDGDNGLDDERTGITWTSAWLLAKL
jgi:hypothetical protein